MAAVAFGFFETRADAAELRRRVAGGVVYGGAGAERNFVAGNLLSEAGWEQGTGALPDVPMAPFDQE